MKATHSNSNPTFGPNDRQSSFGYIVLLDYRPKALSEYFKSWTGISIFPTRPSSDKNTYRKWQPHNLMSMSDHMSNVNTVRLSAWHVQSWLIQSWCWGEYCPVTVQTFSVLAHPVLVLREYCPDSPKEPAKWPQESLCWTSGNGTNIQLLNWFGLALSLQSVRQSWIMYSWKLYKKCHS